MNKRTLSILLCLMMIFNLLPAVALAEGDTVSIKYIDMGNNTGEYSFVDTASDNTVGVYISGSGSCDIQTDCSGYTTIINGVEVTIGKDGAVRTQDMYIFGEGSLIVGDVVFTSGHSIAIDGDSISSVLTAISADGSDVVNISGTAAAETELVVYKATVASGGALEFAGAGSQIIISDGGCLTVEAGATVTPVQDACITLHSGATVRGLMLYDANTTDILSVNDSYTVTTENVDENYVETFIWLEDDEYDESIQKWVLKVDEGDGGDPNAPQNTEYWFEYDWRDGATVTLNGKSVPSRWSEDYKAPINFTSNAAISFTLSPPSDQGEYSPVVEVEAFDGDENTANTVTNLDAANGTYSYTPTKENGFIIRVWWSEAEYDYDTFGPGEGEIAVEVNISGSETATVTSAALNVSKDKMIFVGTKTKYILDDSMAEIELLITPGENEEIKDIIVGWTSREFTVNENGSVNYTWDISDESNRYFEAVFGGTGGEEGGNEGGGETGGEEAPPWYTVSWSGGNVTVENGQVYAERIHVAANGDVTDKTYTIYKGEVDESDHIYYIGDTIERPEGGGEEADNALFNQYGLIFDDQTDLFIRPDFGGVSIDYKFIPDYGYQVTNVYTNENEDNSLLSDFIPGEEISSFTFDVKVNENVHFHVKFEKTEDITNITAANVSGAAIANGDNATSSGNLALTVEDAEKNSSIKNAVSTFDITLDNVVSKGTEERGDWTTSITEFDNPITVSLTLDTAEFTAEDYTVYRVHGESEPEDLTADYNPETGELTFETNKFSEYTVVEKTSGGGTPGTPSSSGTSKKPTATEVEIPISGEDDTVQVGASVSGDKAVIDEVDLSELNSVIGDHVDSVGTVTIDFSGLRQTVDTVEIPADVVKEIAAAVNDPANDAKSLEIVLGGGVSIEFDAAALKEKASQAEGEDITVSMEIAKGTGAQTDAIGNRPAYDITVTSGGKQISDMGGKITVHAPYELREGEHPRGIVVWYVDEDGNKERCETGYDPVKKRVNWKTDHLSLYMIDYCPSATFVDLNIDAWYVNSTNFVIEKGLMNGIGSDKFDPNGITSRAMIVSILWKMEGEPTVNDAVAFEDVDMDRWYTKGIRWAAGSKIVEGYGNGRFGTNDAITREQMVTIMWNYAKYKGYDVSLGEDTNILSYGDAFDVSEWAIPAMQWACGSGLISGIADGNQMNLDPQGSATRVQTAAILQNFIENVVNKE